MTGIELKEEILDIDSNIQHAVRSNWPEAWLQINLPVGSTRALFAINAHEARTPGRVAEVLGVNRTTVTGLLDRLENEGLVTRAIDPTDRRSFVLELTPKATDLISQMESARRDLLAEALKTMPAEDVEALHRGLTSLVAHMRVHDQAPASPGGR